MNEPEKSGDAASQSRRERLTLRQRALDGLARGLGLPATRTRLDWVVGVFFQPPAPGRTDYARRWMRAAVLYFALQWGVLEPHRLRAWLWRAFVRPPKSPAHSAA